MVIIQKKEENIMLLNLINHKEISFLIFLAIIYVLLEEAYFEITFVILIFGFYFIVLKSNKYKKISEKLLSILEKAF